MATTYETYTATRGPVMWVDPNVCGAHTSSVHPIAIAATIAQAPKSHQPGDGTRLVVKLSR